MGIFSRLKGLLRRKKEFPDLPAGPMPMPRTDITTESTTVENVKAKMDLVLTQLDSLRTQYQAMNERVMTTERMVKELYDMAKSS